MFARASGPSSARTVLLVERTEGLAFAVGAVLESGGYAVRVARTGDEGLAWLRAQPFDLVMLGAVASARDVLAAARAARAGACVLVLGRADEPDEAGTGSVRGGRHRLPHPYGVHDLLSRVRAALAEAATDPAPPP